MQQGTMFGLFLSLLLQSFTNFEPPSVSISLLNNRPLDFSVKEGDYVVITCKATGHPLPKTRWDLTGGTLNMRNLDLKNSTLYIPNITRYEAGRVICKASNGIQRSPALATKRLQVLYLDKPVMSVGASGNELNSSSYWYQKSVHFQCHVKSSPLATFVWRKNGSIIMPSTKGIRIENSDDQFSPDISITRLIIKNAKTSDVGTYDCVATLGLSGHMYIINDTMASFFYQPNIAPVQIKILGPTNVVVNKGDSIFITCSVTGGVPQGSVQWLREDGKLMASARPNRLDLYIPQANYSDTATYYCVGSNGVGISPRKKVKVFVRRLGEMTFWITPLRFPKSPDWRLSESSDVRLSCRADADPDFELKYFWFKRTRQNTRVPIESKRVHGLSITLNRNEVVKNSYTIPAVSSRLEIHNLASDDYGVYECAATLIGFTNYTEVNASIPIGRDSAPSKITAPNLTFQVKEGDDVMLRCEASEVPKPLIIFYREDNLTMPSGNDIEVTKDGNLLLRNISRKDDGMYFCEAARYNGFTRWADSATQAVIDVTVLYPPSVRKAFYDQRKARRSKLSLTCIVEDANPLTDLIYEWFKDGVSQGKSNQNNQFQIQSMDDTDYGTYACVVNNSVGQAQCVFNVSNTPYEPELYFPDKQLILSKATGSSDTYNYLLQWTQRHPGAVELIIKYKIRWRLVGDKKWKEGVKLMPNGARYGQLVSYQITNLKSGDYEVVVRSATRLVEGGEARRVIKVQSRPVRDVRPYNLAESSYFCSFAIQSRCQFEQPTSNTINWVLNGKNTQSRRTFGTGPDFDVSDHEKLGAYMYIESSISKRGDIARLVSPFFFHGSSTNHCLRFFYHMQGMHIGRLRVLISDEKGIEKELWKKEKQQGNTWNTQLLDVQQFSQYKVIFEATILQDEGYQGDIAIDDVSLDPVKCVFPFTTVGPRSENQGGGSESVMRVISSQNSHLFVTSIIQEAMHNTFLRTLTLCLVFEFVISKVWSIF